MSFFHVARRPTVSRRGSASSVRSSRALQVACVWIAALALGGCDEVGVASLVLAEGSVERDSANAPHQWSRASRGTVFQLGDAIRTGEDGSAQVKLTQGTVLQLGADSFIRFLDKAPVKAEKGADGKLLGGKAMAGKALDGEELSVGEGAIGVEPGAAVLQTGSIVQLAGGSVEVVEGRATVVTRPEGVVSLGSEQRFAIDVGVPELVEAAESGEPVEIGTNVERVDFTILAGEAATIHDPDPATRLGIDFSKECTRAVIELRDFGLTRLESSTEGESPIKLEIPKGGHRYYVFCLDGGERPVEPAVRGSIVVVKDSGVQPFSAKPPRNTIDADGRRYTLVYQNLKPVLTIRWPRAPRSSAYLLHITPDGRATQSYRTRQPQQVFRSGAILEGNYRYQFQAGNARSPMSAVRLTFDRNARIGYIREPEDGAASGGATVRVEGGAISGSTVRVGAEQLPIDKQFRFAIDAVMPTAQDAFVVRIAHRGAGVHYYIRRLAGVKR